MKLIELATLYRILNLYAHHAHNLAKGKTFFEDHEFFNGVYTFADSAYDDCIERHIGTVDDKVDLTSILEESLSTISKASNDYFPVIEMMLEEVVKYINEMCKDKVFSEGTKNMIQGQADQIEIMIYKIKRRMK